MSETVDMSDVIVSAENLDRAKFEAAAQLGVPVERIVFTVLEESKRLFGRTEVKIRAEVGAEAPPAEKPKRAPRRKAAPAEEPAPVVSGEAVVEIATPAKVEDAAPEPVAKESDAEVFATFLEAILDKMDLDAEVEEPSFQGRYVHLTIAGADAALLTSRAGDGLNSLQYLVNLFAIGKVQEGARAVLDASGYRDKRAETLVKMALDVAREVKGRGEEAVLEPLPSFERRIVHQALAEFGGVTTYSEGDEPYRRVVITPED